MDQVGKPISHDGDLHNPLPLMDLQQLLGEPADALFESSRSERLFQIMSWAVGKDGDKGKALAKVKETQIKIGPPPSGKSSTDHLFEYITLNQKS